MTDAQTIANARPYREACAPDECTGGERCWVAIGATGIARSPAGTRVVRCVQCLGKIHTERRTFPTQGIAPGIAPFPR